MSFPNIPKSHTASIIASDASIQGIFSPRNWLKGSNRANFYHGLIPWAPISLEAPSKATSDAVVRGNHAGSGHYSQKDQRFWDSGNKKKMGSRSVSPRSCDSKWLLIVVWWYINLSHINMESNKSKIKTWLKATSGLAVEITQLVFPNIIITNQNLDHLKFICQTAAKELWTSVTISRLKSWNKLN